MAKPQKSITRKLVELLGKTRRTKFDIDGKLHCDGIREMREPNFVMIVS